jgi:hypothetical protein
MRIAALVLVLAACGTRSPSTSSSGSASGSATATDTATASATATDSATATAPGPDACTSPDDCTISCTSDPTDCCGDSRGCTHPYSRAHEQAIESERRTNCAGKDFYQCPKDRSARRPFWPACDNGRCSAYAAPERRACKTDDDCTTSTAVIGSCCGACEPSIWEKSELAAFEQWRTAQCASYPCPPRTCPQSAPKRAGCVYGTCVSVRPR